MEPDERRAFAVLFTDHQRDMFAQIVSRTERHDFRILTSGDRQVRARRNRQPGGISPYFKVGHRNGLQIARRLRINEEGRQNTCQPRQFHRGASGGHVAQRFSRERAFHRMSHIECRIGDSASEFQIERLSRADQNRGFRCRCFALVRQFERCRPCR